jgi:hypothetical protein
MKARFESRVNRFKGIFLARGSVTERLLQVPCK